LQQRDLWFLDRPEHLGSAHDNVQFAFQVTGPLDRNAWARAVRAVVDRHSVLRTSYVRRDGAVLQRVNDGVDIDVPVLPFDSGFDDTVATEWLRAERARPFAPGDLCQLRVHLLARSDTDHLVVVTRPWGVVDGWSTDILL
ncbi:condensation domain-containing protein, partial [Streptomyces sp. MCAF7]